MKKVLILFIVLLILLIVLVISIERYKEEVMITTIPEPSQYYTTQKENKDNNDEIEYKQKVQVNDFIVTVSPNYELYDADDETIGFHLKKNEQNKPIEKRNLYAEFEIEGGTVKKVILYSLEDVIGEFSSKGSNKINIPDILYGKTISSLVATIQTEDGEINLSFYRM